MATPAQRFQGWIETLSEAWKERLHGWFISWVVRGLTDALEDINPEQKAALEDILHMITEDPNTPPQLKTFLEHATERGNPLIILAAIILVPLMFIPMVTGTFRPLGKLFEHKQERLLKTLRLDPISVINAWRRDKPTYEWLFDDLKDQGWSAERIDALKFFTLFMPSAGDIVSWYAREVYEPDMVERYGLDSELPSYEQTDFPKIGVDATQAKNYWMAHWVHASYMQIREMLHRGVLSLDKEMPAPPTTKEGWAARDAEGTAAAYDWFRLVEIPPFWRARLTEMMFEVPTRVDVRRFWDMRTISEERLRSIYHAQGYHGKDLEDYILWTKVYVAFPDLIARWSKGWITLDDVRAELVGYGMPADRLEELIQTKIKAEQPERTSAERDITKSDIIKGVKTGVITREEGIELLMDMGYDEDEADYILLINIPRDEEDVVVTERKISKADILKGLKTEVITRGEAMTRLMDLRYSATDAEFLLKIYDAQVKVPEEPKLREASKADIVLGVTKGLIDQSEGYSMLLDLGFTPEASAFILMVKTEESPFSPINFGEFKDITQKYRVATGKEAKPMTEELKAAAAEVVRLTGEVEALARSIVEEKRGLIEDEVLPEETTARLTELQVSKNRAIAALELAKSEYKSKLAEWRHG